MFREGEFDIEFWIEPPLLNAIYEDSRAIAGRLDLTAFISDVKALRDSLSSAIRPIQQKPGQYFTYAIDSSFPQTPLELVGGVLTVVSYGYVGQAGGVTDKYVTGTVIFEDSSEVSKSIELFSKVKERELAIRLLRDKKRGRRVIDMIILDGEIYIHPLPYNLPSKESSRKRIEEVVDRMIALAEDTQTTLVGVVKRVRSRYLSIFLNRCLEVNDKLAMSLVLRRGEYANVGSFREILPRWIRVNYMDCEVKKGMGRDEAERRLNEGLQNLERVFTGDGGRLRGVSRIGDLNVLFYKAQNSSIATKVEVLDFAKIGHDKIVSYLASQTTSTGYPYLLDLVDVYVRVNPMILDYVRTLLLKNVGAGPGEQDVKEVVTSLLQLTNPQKAYLYKQLEG